MKVLLIALLVCCISAQVEATSTYEPTDQGGYILPSLPYYKRSSLSNMMRIGKRDSSASQGSRNDLAGCEDCNLGTLMRIGRR
ncbi:unnamed protein product [Caenorhabditis auriculariae]|uniref:Uncharacterized protein n=1 Tax=Caenorhabditis auriculariae TaxID=2777116 RepID=A0A8S1H666_9PELO|nr:unnamed protein product [Caenorhabditis auriculariae]